MTVQYNYDICNMAFSMLGSMYASDQAMTSATFTTPTLQHHIEAVRFYDAILYSLLSEHNWQFTRRRIELDADNFEIDVTSGTNANPGVLTATAHGVPEGSGVYLYDFGVDDLDNTVFIAKNVATNTLQLYYPDNITSFNTTSSGTIGTGHMRLHPVTNHEYKFKLPTDFLRLWKVTEYVSRWEVQDNMYLLTDDYNPLVEYVALVTTVTSFPQEFCVCFARRLALEIASGLSNKPQWVSVLNARYNNDLGKALLKNIAQDHARDNGNKVDFYRESPWCQAGR